MARFVWAKRSAVYHDNDTREERCNGDDLRDKQEGDTPPKGRRLCWWCRRRSGDR